MNRTVAKIFEAKPTIEGAGVHLHRGFGFPEAPHLDPFLLFDDFSSPDFHDYLPGFPEHPHRGIETVTYLLSGAVRHKDSMGNEGTIGAGDIQWMTAGSGIIHEEMPQKTDGGIRGFQLWVNLPAKNKMMTPRYQDIKANEVPAYEGDGVAVKVIAGAYRGVVGPVRDLMVEPMYLYVTLAPGATFTVPLPKDHTAFLYVVEGVSTLESSELRERQVAHLSHGDEVSVTASDTGAQFLFVAGAPLKEPVAWYGPIVMNTEEELRTAFVEYQEGKFIKTEAVGM